MSATTLLFVLADRMREAEFEAVCSTAGFDVHGAQRFGALYAGPTRSERTVAAGVAERLWLPVIVEPQLSGLALELDDEPASPQLSREDQARVVGTTALEIGRRHPAGHVAIVIKSTWFAVLAEALRANAAVHARWQTVRHAAVHTLELDAGFATQTAIDDFLRQLGADRIEHPGGTLLAHLQRTALRLASWHARPELVAAGHCHALYGTDGFPHALLSPSERPRLAERLGAETEALVYSYGSCDRAAGYPFPGRPLIRDRFTDQRVPLTPAAIRDFLTLVCANELDVLAHAPPHLPKLEFAIESLLRQCAPLCGAQVSRTIHSLIGDA